MNNVDPIGTILMFPSLNLPKGYLLCNGAKFNTIIYSELAQILKSDTLPNFTDRFPRSVGPSTANKALHYQSWTTANPRNKWKTSEDGEHQHTYEDWATYINVANMGTEFVLYEQINTETEQDGGHIHIISGGDSETRPQSATIYFIIKAI